MNQIYSNFVLVFLVIGAAILSFVLSNALGNRLFPLADATQDVWFDSDTRLVAMNMTIREHHHRTLYKHPLFSIIAWPITSVVRIFVDDAMTAVRIVQAANAGLVVLLLFWLLARIGLSLLDRSLCAMLFIASSTMVFWYTVPETFSFGGTTMLIALHAAISARPTTPLGYLGHGLASFATFTMTITNWVAGLVATATAYGLLDSPISLIRRWLNDIRSIWSDIKWPVLISVAVLLVAVVLAVVQDFIFGEASLFFNVFALLKEKQFVADYGLSGVALRPLVLVFSPIVVGTLGTWFDGARLTAEVFIPRAWPGMVALGLWATLLASGTISALRILFKPTDANLQVRRMIIASVLSLAAFVLVHTVYGLVAFLYVAHTAPYLLAITATSFLRGFKTLTRILMLLLIVFAGYHNCETFQQAVDFVHTTVPELPLP